MIKFEDNKAIYEQMADRLCDEIIAGTYKADDRIPSVREYAVMLQVNTNTAMQNPALHQEALRRKVFLTRTLPSLFREMNLLGITMEEIEEEWTKLQRQ